MAAHIDDEDAFIRGRSSYEMESFKNIFQTFLKRGIVDLQLEY